MKLIPAIKYDVLFQLRQKIYYLYIGVTLLYIIGLHFVPVKVKIPVTIMMIISDPVLIGFFFIGGIILLEKDNNILSALFVTPLSVMEYIFSKIITLGGITLAASLLIVFSGTDSPINLPLFMITILISSCIFTFVGIIISANVSTLNQYMFVSSCCEVLLFTPLIHFFGFYDHVAFRLIPSDAALTLIQAAVWNQHDKIFIPLAILVLWFMVLLYASHKSLNNYVLKSGGGES